jgi:hypothetical protein
MIDSPDRTARLSLRGSTGRSRAQAAQFVWPAPPYYEFTQEPKPQGERCLLTFADGARSTGLLQGFLPEFEMLTFIRDKAKSAETIGFPALLGVSLLDPAELRRQNIPGEGDTDLHQARAI